MKKFFSNLMAALVAIMAVNLFLPVASADALSYSLDPVTVNLDAAQSGRFQITVQPDAPFGGVDFLVSLPSEVEITSVSYSVSGISPSPGEREGGIYFGISSLMNAYTDPLVCTVNIKYTGTGTAPSDIVIFLVRLTKYTGEIGVIDTAIVPPFGANLVTAVPNSGSNPPSPVPAVTGVTVTPGTASVTRGTTQQFTASVAAVGGAAETV
ncbi:MAG: hypothetical protein LBK75_08940, partial [Oscillospiraceae bacterium]|nr:hypothetical protein [Oscillospiraceae bacterium]